MHCVCSSWYEVRVVPPWYDLFTSEERNLGVTNKTDYGDISVDECSSKESETGWRLVGTSLGYKVYKNEGVQCRADPSKKN